MGFFSGFKKVISAPISLVEDVYGGIKTVVTDTYGGIESAFSTVGDASKKVVGTTWDATEEVAETIGAEGAIGYAIGGGAGLAAGTYLKQQQEQREQTLEQQKALAGLGLSGAEIGFLQATAPQVNPFDFLSLSPGGGVGYRQPEPSGLGIISPLQYGLSPDRPSENGFDITSLIPYAAIGIGAVLLLGAFKK